MRGVEWPYELGAFARLTAAAALLGVLTACTGADKSIPVPDAVDPVRHADFGARFPAGGGPTVAGGSGPGRYLIAPGGDDDGAQSLAQANPAAPGAAATPGGITINLDGVDIQTAAKTLLGDVLRLNFIIDPRVQGTVTLVSVAPVPRDDVLPIFEAVLRISNAALVRDGRLVRIVPLPEAIGNGAVSVGAGSPGFGVSVVPLHYTSAANVAKLAEAFLTRPGALRADATHNFVLVQGTSEERRTALDMIATFDVEWLRNQSVGVYPLKSTQPETMIQELDRIFETGDGGLGQGVVKLQPISRMNAVMAVVKSPKMLERVTQWIERLDRGNTGGTALRVYRLKYADAKQVAHVMTDLFVGKSGEAPSSQLAPGTATTQSRLDSLTPSASSGTGSATGGAGQTGIGSGGGTNQGFTVGGRGTGTSPFQGFGNNPGDADQDNGNLTAGNLPRGLFQNVRITADTGNNSIVIYSNLEDFHVIERALHDIDQPKLQVAIHATVAEVTLTDALQYGVQSFLTSANLGMAPDKGSVGQFPSATTVAPATTTTTVNGVTTTSTATAVATQLLSRVLPGFNLLLGPEAQPNFILSALSNITEVKVLSSPSLVALDNQPAMLEVGQDIPVQTSTATVLTTGSPIVNTIDMRQTGIILKILPHVHANGTVQLEIEQEISNVINPEQPTLTPTISERRIRSTVAVTNGQTVLLGGLIADLQDNTKSGIPGVNQIQYLGDLLGTTSKSKTRSEIIVFIKPEVIRNSVDMRSVTEEFRERLQSMHANDSLTGASSPDAPSPTAGRRR